MIPGNFDIDYIIKECKVNLSRDILEEMLKYKGFECLQEMSDYYFTLQTFLEERSVTSLPAIINRKVSTTNKTPIYFIKTVKNKYITIEYIHRYVNSIPYIFSIKTSSKNINLYTINYEGQLDSRENKPVFNWEVILDKLVIDWNIPKFVDLNLVYSRIPENKPKKKVVIFSKFLSGNHDPFGVRIKWENYKRNEARRRIKL